MSARWRLLTPESAAAAIAIFQIEAEDAEALEATLADLGLFGSVERGAHAPLAVGEIVLRDLLGVDRGLLMRPSDRCAQLMPHGGVAIVRAISNRLRERLGDPAPDPADDPRAAWPEARSLIEARTLEALARTQSPRGIDLLLDQPARWAESDSPPEHALPHTRASRAPLRRPPRRIAPSLGPSFPLDTIRNRLIDPPLVVATGPANIGKSTLLNALAGRTVAITHDAPGTTRDHVGAMLILDGLAVRYVDTPGLRPAEDAGAVEAEAARIAAEVKNRADLLLLCGDGGSPPPAPPPTDNPDRSTLTIALRADLTPAPFDADASVAAIRDEGLAELARLIRRALVPDRAIEDPVPWRFWD